jgi:hypothetical protein
MKKKLFLLVLVLIVVYLLSFVGISYSSENFTNGEFWNKLASIGKSAYIAGVINGVKMWTDQISDENPFRQFTSKEAEVKFSTFVSDNLNFLMLFRGEISLKTFINVISDLYKDPANTYIPVSCMCLIASRKLRGEPIELLLQETRKKALQY